MKSSLSITKMVMATKKTKYTSNAAYIAIKRLHSLRRLVTYMKRIKHLALMASRTNMKRQKRIPDALDT